MKDRIITLATYSFSRAQLLQGCLESAGVECFLKNINLLQSAIGGGVKIRIREEDLICALTVIEDFKLTYVEKDEDKVVHGSVMELNRIMVPVDFSDSTPRICDYAYNMAVKFHADILLFHTYFASAIETVPFSDSYTYNATVVEVLAEVEKNAQKKIEELKDYLTARVEKDKIDGVEIDIALSGGIASSEIISMTKSYKPDLLVMGSRGETAGTSNLLGSVVSSIIDNIEVPMLILSDRGENPELDEIKEVMYATDFDKADFKAIATLKYITEPFFMNIHCVHFEKDNNEEHPLEEHRMGILRKYLKRSLGDDTVHCQVCVMEDKMKGIESYVQDHNIGMIAIMARKHNLLERLFFGQMSRKLFVKTHMPILIFH
jgi:nucleotide-binding universal stress UspA family protein